MTRQHRQHRKTRETEVTLTLDLDGTGKNAVKTGLPFWDHMLTLLSTHSLIDLDLAAKGDLEIDAHHTLEDVGITLGMALKAALGDCKGITRFADVTVPMDEALARCVLDISNRPFLAYTVEGKTPDPNSNLQLAEEFFRALAQHGGFTCHLTIQRGANEHHMLESAFKALARALRLAVAIDPHRPDQIPSSKGVL